MNMRQKAKAVILQYGVHGFSILDADFVDAFVASTGASYSMAAYGIKRCNYLNKQLTALHQEGLLDHEVQLNDPEPGSGVPNWVYFYTLNNQHPENRK